jgi:FkbM family methyltransferase
MLAASRGALKRAILFEPNPANFQFLQKRFAGANEIQLQPFACDAEAGERKFFCAGETYTGSLLRYETATASPPQETAVRCIRLDDFLAEQGLGGKVGLLKIDTQGNDLRVLGGANNLLRNGRPWIVCELIHLPLYESQASPHEIARFLAGHDYVVGSVFNEYYTHTGWIGWCDACFVPREVIGAVPDAFQRRPTAEQERQTKRGVLHKIRRQIERTFRHGSH